MDGHTRVTTVNCFLFEDKCVGVLVQTRVKKCCFDLSLSGKFSCWVVLYLLEGLSILWQLIFLHYVEWSLARKKMFDSLVTIPAIYLASVGMALWKSSISLCCFKWSMFSSDIQRFQIWVNLTGCRGCRSKASTNESTSLILNSAKTWGGWVAGYDLEILWSIAHNWAHISKIHLS